MIICCTNNGKQRMGVVKLLVKKKHEFWVKTISFYQKMELNPLSSNFLA